MLGSRSAAKAIVNLAAMGVRTGYVISILARRLGGKTRRVNGSCGAPERGLSRQVTATAFSTGPHCGAELGVVVVETPPTRAATERRDYRVGVRVFRVVDARWRR